MHVLLTGASGFLGRRLQQRLLADGHQLRLLVRKAPATPAPGVAHFLWPNFNTEPPAAALEGCDAIVHLAGEPVAQRWTDDVKRAIRESRVEGTRRLVQALTTQTRRPTVLICASATGYYGSRGNETLTESSAPGSDYLAQLCREWEQQADLAEALGLRVVKMRIGVVLGPEGGALPLMLPPFRLGVGGKLSDGRQWMSWVHVDDVIDLFATALANQKYRGPVNAVAPNPVENQQFTKDLGQALHRPAVFRVPAFALKLALGEMSTVMIASQRVLPKVAQQAGFSYRFPELLPALQDILASPMLK